MPMLQNAWKWSKSNEKSLAQFVNGKAFELLPKLPINRSDLINYPEGRKEIIKAIYETLVSFDIRYAHEEYQPENEIQLIRTPFKILSQPGEGTCLDLALLFCSICFGCDLLPLLILIDGHALAAVSLNYKRDQWNKPYEPERNLFNTPNLFIEKENLEKLQQFIDDEDYIAIECTGFARAENLNNLEQPEAKQRQQDGTLKFERAVKVGEQQIRNSKRPFKFAIDIATAQNLWKIEPLEIVTKSASSKEVNIHQHLGLQENAETTGAEARGEEAIDRNFIRKQETKKLYNSKTTGLHGSNDLKKKMRKKEKASITTF